MIAYRAAQDPSTIYFVDFAAEKVEVYHNHDFNGSGCNNLHTLLGGKVYDLEFCRSFELWSAEVKLLSEAIVLGEVPC